MAFVAQVLQDGARNYIVKVTGTGVDTAALLVDVSAMNPPATRVILQRVLYDIEVGGQVQLLWDATTDTTLLHLSAGNGQTMRFEDIGGLTNDAGAGVTGDVMITSTAHEYSIVLWFKKGGVVTPVSQ